MMAEKALKKVEDQLNCPICLETYTDPKMLQCFHIYCQKCLTKLLNRQGQQQFITCPTCRQATPVPAEGTAGLQSAFHINHLLQIVKEHKKEMTLESQTESDSTSSVSHAKAKGKVYCCLEHAKKVELYCDTCGKLICWKCIVKGGKHCNHNYEELEKAFERYKKEIASFTKPMEEQLATVSQALTQLDLHCGEVSNQEAAAETKLHEAFEKLQTTLNRRKSELVNLLHQVTRRKLQGLEAQRYQLETTQAQLSSCLGYMKESLETGSKQDVLSVKTIVAMQVKELTSTLSLDTLQPCVEADMTFSIPVDITTYCQSFGKIAAAEYVDPSKCQIDIKDSGTVTAGEKCTSLTLLVNDSSGHLCNVPFKSSKIELVSELTGIKTSGKVRKITRSKYEISYQPTVKGRHQLHVSVEGQEVGGSPVTVAVKSPVEKLGAPILTLRGMKNPQCVAFDQRRQELVVTEYSSVEMGAVSVFSLRGEKLRAVKPGYGQFGCPYGVAVDGEGNILVTDTNNHRIQKFAADGQLLQSVGKKGSEKLCFNNPFGISFNTKNNKVYVTDYNSRVQVLNSDLTFSGTFGKHGSGRGQFKHPAGIAFDSSGNVYVADRDNHRIQVFTTEGKFLRMFGKDLDSPTNVASDADDHLYVTRFDDDLVSVFTCDGELVTKCGGHSKQYSLCRGIAVDNCGLVYVCDEYNGCIQIY